MDSTDYVPGPQFHDGRHTVYSGELGWAVNKQREQMARVVYEPVHENLACEGERRGHGRDYATWVFSEEPGLAEGLFSTPFELMIDARLEPNASIGLHRHDRTEEVYYMLEGSLRVTTVAPDGREASADLRAGDAHLVRLGQSHFATAGADGARFLAIAVRR